VDIFWSVVAILLAYFLAGIPWGVVLGRWIKGIDVRNYGSGATGTTNSLRMLGWRIAVAVLVLDFGKGVLPVVIGRIIDLPDWAIGITAIAATVGHCWSPYIRFKGGKGMATGGGASVAMFPWLILFATLVILIVWRTRYVSLGSILTAIIGPASVVVLALFGVVSGWWAAAIVVIGLIIVFQHRSNIDRLIKGTERKFGQKESAQQPAG
jgi:acyl phosphate:glycerol-3-phosphate acyltransferase